MIAQNNTQSAFAAALAAKAKAIQAKYDAAQAPAKVKPEPTPEPVRVTVDIVANKNRIDVYFSAKPSDSVLSELRSKGFHFRPSDKAWYHQDNTSNRAFLIERFNAHIEIELSKLAALDDDLDQVLTDAEIKAACAKNAPTLDAEDIIEAYAAAEPEVVEVKSEYHRIIDALCEHFGESPADVCVRAVKLLHSETFL